MNWLKPKKGACIYFKGLVKRGDIPQKQSKVEYMVLANYSLGLALNHQQININFKCSDGI